MNALCKLLMRDSPRLVASTKYLILAAALLPVAAYAASYVDLRRIEPIRGDLASGAAKTTACVACHGPFGNSMVAQFPSLAGQRADYLYQRLAAFKAVNPKDPNYASSPMPAQVQNLSDQDLRNISLYFSAQVQIAAIPPPAAAVDGRGAALYPGGDPARGVPPCQGCPGVDALGGPVEYGSQYLAYPLLRGQHAAYLVSRLTNFRSGLPNGSSSDFIMHGVALTLDDRSIQSLAAWLESLAPAAAK